MSDTSFIDQFDAFFFDLDGTLLGFSDDTFEGMYMKMISERFSPHIPREDFIKALWKGTEDMMKHNDPSSYVLDSFFKTFTSITGIDTEITFQLFDEFYSQEFNELKQIADPVPEARKLIDSLKKLNKKVVLATNPVFPEIATRNRCKWTDLDFDEFDHVSHAQNSYACKPYPEYYLTLCELVDVDPSRVLMIGNDYLYDMAASKTGMKTWITDKYLGNEEYKDKFDIDYTGSLHDLLNQINESL